MAGDNHQSVAGPDMAMADSLLEQISKLFRQTGASGETQAIVAAAMVASVIAAYRMNGQAGGAQYMNQLIEDMAANAFAAAAAQPRVTGHA